MKNFAAIFSTLIVSFLFLISNVFAQDYKRPEIIMLKLDNGLTIILNPDPAQKSMFGGVGVRAGSKNDPADMTGIAHYLEHMLFKGTTELGTSDFAAEKPHLDRINLMYEELAQVKDEEQRKALHKKINESSLEAGKYAIATEFDKLVRSIGGSGLNAFTGEEITFYFNAFPSHQLEKWLDLYSHRFYDPVFRLFQSELEVVYEEKNMYDDNFITAIFELFLKNLYKKHPYGQQTTIGTTEHLKNPSLMRMYNFFHTYYASNNMVLVLTGNFNVDKATEMIYAKFGKLRKNDIPEFPVFEELPFNGRELIEARLSPVKLGVMGFRTVPNNHPDEAAMDVCDKILSNDGETGLLNKLVLDNKLMFAGTLPMGRNNDYGAGIILIIPKIIGQSLTKAENLVLEQLDKLRKGEFSDALLEACKNELYVQFVSQLEDPQMRTVYLAQAFSQHRNIDNYLNYPTLIKEVTKEDVIRVANAYYNKNYLVLHSKMGFPKKEKLEKPGYDPVKPNEKAVSPYAEKFYAMPEEEPVTKFVDFNEDLAKIKMADKIHLYHAPNPYNDIYTLTIKAGTGSFNNINLPYASRLMNYAGTETRSMEQVKQAFHDMGTTCTFSCDESYVYIELEGLETNFSNALSLLNELLQTPVAGKDKIKLIVNEEKTTRKIEDKEPSEVARALQEYIRKGENSSYIKRLSLKAIKKLKPAALIAQFKEALIYETEIHFCGTLSPKEVQANLKESLKFPADMKPTTSPVHVDDNAIKENVVYFVNDKKAVQSQIYFIANGNKFDISQAAMYDAFNEYFGGGFSGLVVQEIREYRSMAYATGATLRTPPVEGKKNAFVGYIGTQADKTSDALDVFMGLFRNMPVKEERMDVLRSSLVQEALADQPAFRELTLTVSKWIKKGYTEDPARNKAEKFKSMNFDDIVKFYTSELKDKPVAICIVGDESRLDMKHIAGYGKVVKVEQKKLFTK